MPCVLILGITCWAIVANEIKFYNEMTDGDGAFYANNSFVLFSLGGIIFVLSLWMVAETVAVFCHRGTEKTKI